MFLTKCLRWDSPNPSDSSIYGFRISKKGMPRLKYVHRRRLRRLLYFCFVCTCSLFALVMTQLLWPTRTRTENKLYVYWMSIDDELEADMDLNFDDIPNIITIRVPTSSHTVVAKQAYRDNHPLVLVLKDDVQIAPELFSAWEKLIVTAPADWTMLQLWTNNNVVRRHCEALNDPWIAWFPEHSGDSAYFLNRKGMKQIISHTGNVFSRGRVYTSTRFFVKVQQLFELATRIPKWPVDNTHCLIITTTVIENVQDFRNELSDWQSDFLAVKADWHLTIIVRHSEMQTYVQQHWPQWPNVQMHTVVLQGQYNKFSFIKRSVAIMDRYKRVLIKDSDIGLSGFPWHTFVAASRNAVISGALRQIEQGTDTRQWFHFQDGDKWKREFIQQFRSVEAQSVPFLEQFLVMMDGTFAKTFFHRTLTDAFLLNEDGTRVQSNWGLDTIWCGAAREWGPDKTPCLLVPVVATHRDTRQVLLWNSTAHRKYINMVQVHKYKQAFPQWLFYDRSDVTHKLETVK